MATVTGVRYKRRKRIGDEASPMVFALKPKFGDAKIYSIELLAREIETIGSLSVEDVSHVLILTLLRDYPGCRICGHRDLSPDLNGNGEIKPEEWIKACPCFEVKKE